MVIGLEHMCFWIKCKAVPQGSVPAGITGAVPVGTPTIFRFITICVYIGDHVIALLFHSCIQGGFKLRGLPYMLPQYPVLLSHGTWAGVPDFDAIQQLQHPDVRDINTPDMLVPRGVFFPVCAMNMAFHKSLLPWIYQAPMGRKLEQDGLPPIDRFADIWGGVIAKHAIDNILKGAAWTGGARVYHKRASNVFTNLRKEALGMELNEDLWKWAGRICQGFNLIDEYEVNPYLKLYHDRLIEWQKEVKTYGIF